MHFGKKYSLRGMAHNFIDMLYVRNREVKNMFKNK